MATVTSTKYYQSEQIKDNETSGLSWEIRNTNKTLVGKPKGTRPLVSPRHRPRWKDNIKIDLREIECELI
jgi:hypothetical protein